MKKTKLYSIVLLSGLLVAGIACKKEKNPPTITIKGSNPASITVGAVYSDAGATAANDDGSSVTVDTDLSEVNTDAYGSFKVNYSAENEHGTTNKSRTVNVTFDESSYIKSWTVTSDCGATAFPIAGTQDPASGSDLTFDNFFTLVGGTASATISGNTITFPSQTIAITGGDIIFDGSGTMNAAGTAFSVTFNYDNTVPLVGGTGTCTADFAL